jgi:hypothetical protein
MRHFSESRTGVAGGITIRALVQLLKHGVPDGDEGGGDLYRAARRRARVKRARDRAGLRVRPWLDLPHYWLFLEHRWPGGQMESCP